MIVRLWWMVQKDLVSEYRAMRIWPAMLLLGIVVAVILTARIDAAAIQKSQMTGVLLWLTVFFAGLPAIDRSCSAERSEGCWDALLAYPMSSTLIYWSKFLVNVFALTVLVSLLIPVFSALTGVDLLHPWWAIALVALLANLGIAAVGTFLSAVASGISQGSPLLVLLLLPMMIPLVLAAAESTRLIALEQINDQWWRWVQLLGGFAVIYLTAGAMFFEFATEE